MRGRIEGRWGAWLAAFIERVRHGWLVVAVVGLGLAVGSTAFGDSSGPTLTVDQGFNGGQPMGPAFPADGAGGGAGGVITGSVIQPDGKVVVVGDNPVLNNGNLTADFDVARFNSDGTLDRTFASNGYAQVAPTPGSVNSPTAVALDPQTGDIVIAGADLSGAQGDVPELVRLTSSGALDMTFGSNGSEVDSAHPGSFLKGVVVDSSSRIVTIGSDGVARRYTAAGAPDTTFASSGHTAVLISQTAFGTGTNAIALQPADGKILVAGYSQTSGTNNATVVRLHTDGSLDATFGSGGTATVSSGTGGDAITSMTLQGTSIVIAGSDSGGDTLLARLTSGGALDTTFGTSGFDTFPPPNGFTSAQAQAVFYDPNPGEIVCYNARGNGQQQTGCLTTGTDGGHAGNPVTADTGGNLNNGSSFNPTLGKLAVGSYKLDLFDANDSGSCGSITIDPTTLPAPVVGTAYSQLLVGSPLGVYTFAVTSGILPPGLMLSPSGVLNGTPTQAGSYTFTVTASNNSTGCPGSQTYTVTVGTPPPQPPPPTSPPSPTGQCDWTVKFFGAPNGSFEPLDKFPAGWNVAITNAGTADCPAATLAIDAFFPINGRGRVVLDPKTANVPGLAPRRSYGVSLVIKDVTLYESAREDVVGKGMPEFTVTAEMPHDGDGAFDEQAIARVAISEKSIRFEGTPGELDVTCPGNAGAACDFSLEGFLANAGGAMDATAVRPLLIGSAHGRLKRGRRGHIHFELTKAGRKLLQKRHKLQVTLVGTRTQGGVELLIEGHVTFSLRH